MSLLVGHHILAQHPELGGTECCSHASERPRNQKRSKRKVRKVIALMIKLASENKKLPWVDPPYKSGEFDS